LCTNAIKYGALAQDEGAISINWELAGLDGARTLKLEWREMGVPIIGTAPRRRGFGTELIERTLQYELDARTHLAYDVGGLRCEIELPLNQQTLAEAG
jgi:two-component system, chemotaxis family, CheB/CheR fusion protein